MENNSTIPQKIEMALVETLYKQASVGFIAALICGTIVVIDLYKPENKVAILSWYFFLLIVILIRSIMVNKFLQIQDHAKHLSLWRNSFILGACISGITWGLTVSPLLMQHNSVMDQTLILLILAGMSAGSVPYLAPVRQAAVGFLVFALVPLIITIAILENGKYVLFCIAVIVFMLSLIALSFRTHNMLKNFLQLKFLNDELLRDLSYAKNELELINKKLQEAATHDPLTRIANRNLFELYFKDALNKAEREKNNLALFYLDLDNFKDVNDLYGHTAGDQLLIIVVARIKNIVKEKDVIFRMGGDELTIILQDVPDIQTVSYVAERICEAISKPVQIDNSTVLVHASIGISVYPSDGKDMDTLLRVADRAMYYVKDHGGNSFHFNIHSETT